MSAPFGQVVILSDNARPSQRLARAGVECRALVRPGKDVPAGVTHVDGDLLDPGSLAPAVNGVEAVVHLAAVFRTTDADLIWRSDLEGTRNLIAAVRAHIPQARFIMTSTGVVYDADLAHPAREDDSTAPTAPYPASKVAAERELRDSDLLILAHVSWG